MTPASKSRQRAFSSALKVRGRLLAASSGETIKGIIHEEPTLPDPFAAVQQAKPVYSSVSIEAGAVADPHSLVSLTEAASKRTHKVLRFDESASDEVTWKFFCESTRLKIAQPLAI